MDLAGGTALIIRRMILPLTAAVIIFHSGQGFAQGAFPAPLPGRAPPANDPAFPPVNGAARAPAADPAFPPVNGAAPAASMGGAFPLSGAAPIAGAGMAPAPPTRGGAPSEQCMKEFVPLREDAEKRGKMIKAASDRKASAQEACKLIGNYGAAEAKMIKYVEGHAAKCGIPPEIGEQLKNGHKGTEAMQKRVCTAAAQMEQQAKGPAGPTLSDVLGSAGELPEAKTAKKGGNTFDTLNGNALER
jgi:hypothetical protein